MKENNHGANFIADQRYYHFIFARNNRGTNLAEYWRRLGRLVNVRASLDYKDSKAEIQHRKLRSSTAFARGAVAEALSEDGTGRPPYLYDVIAAATTIRGDRYFAFGFPFVGLAAEIMRELMDGQAFFKRGEVLGVDVSKLIASAEEGLNRFDSMSAQVVGVKFIVTDDKSLTAVRLGGDDPLSAEVYVEFLRQKVKAGYFLPNHCVLACEREWENGESSEVSRAFRSRLHVARDGHFKFYAHVGCSNLRLIPYALGQLKSLGCFEKVYSNPFLKTTEDED
ncbi:MAG TPA: hypothetical protein VHP37_13725 [Burkholderiales bacterium]|nr:hypothetical protein [Burkholderiales bacterium]